MVNQFFLLIGIFVPFLPLLLLDVFDPDPEAFEDPEKFNILRNQENNISFGQGPHYCIGVTLVRSQVEVMFNEVFSRFPSLELTDDIAYDYFHHNARRMNKFILKTNF